MLVKSSILYAPAMLAPRLASFALILYLTRRLGPAEFGLFSLVTVVGEILDMSASNWVRFSLLRSDTLRTGAWRDAFFKCGVLLAGTTLVACLTTLLASIFMAHERVLGFAFATSAYIASNSFLRFGLTTLQMRGNRLEYSGIESLRSIGILASAWVVASRSGPTFVDVALANALVTVGFALYAVGRGLVGLPAGTEAATGYRSRLIYGLPIIALQIVQYTVASSDRIALKLLTGASTVGLYAAGYALARVPIDIVGNAVNQGGFPAFMRVYDDEGPIGAARFIENAFELMTLLLFAALGLSIGVAHVLAEAFLPAKYQAVVPAVLPLIALGGVLMGLKSYVFDNIFHAVRRNWLQVLTYGPAGVATSVFCFLLIPQFGSIGAASAFVIGASCGLTTSYLVTRRMVRLTINGVELIKALAAAVLGGITAHILETTLHGLPAIVVLMLSGGIGAAVWSVAVFALRPRILEPARDRIVQSVRGFPARG
jgi:O-antigen/teichoic acid export membrane protein